MLKNKKGQKTNHKFLLPFTPVQKTNQRIHMDQFEPLKLSGSGKKHILCITDAFLKYLKLVAIQNKYVPTAASVLFSRWLCRHGLPLEIA
jgi:hypothetical protein